MQNQTDLKVEQQAIEWFTLVRSDMQVGRRIAEFEQWFHADIAHSRAYQKVEALWTRLGSFANKPEMHNVRNQALLSVGMFNA